MYISFSNNAFLLKLIKWIQVSVYQFITIAFLNHILFIIIKDICLVLRMTYTQNETKNQLRIQKNHLLYDIDLNVVLFVTFKKEGQWPTLS